MGKSAPEGKKYSYMDTYGDLVTLLLCFFVLLFAMSTVEEAKYNAFVEALTDRFGTYSSNFSQVTASAEQDATDVAEEPPPEELPPQMAQIEDLAQTIQDYVQENGLEGEVHVEVGASGAAYIRLSNNLLFDGNSSTIRPEAIVFLDFVSDCLLELKDQIFKVNCLGHTASVDGSGVDDWVLSAERSGKVASHFEKVRGFPGSKLETTGYGRQFPIADNGDSVERAKNRRVDIVVIGNDPDKLAMALVEAAGVYFPNDDTSFFEGAPEELPANYLQDLEPNGDDQLSLTDLTPEQIQDLMNQMDNS